MAEYKESLFWNFVNRTKSLRPLELTDKGMFSCNCLAIGDHMTPRCDHMTILHPHRYVQCRAGDCRVVTTIISLQSPRFLSLSPPVLASYRDVSTGMFVHLIAGDHTLLPGVTMLRLPWSNWACLVEGTVLLLSKLAVEWFAHRMSWMVYST